MDDVNVHLCRIYFEVSAVVYDFKTVVVDSFWEYNKLSMALAVSTGVFYIKVYFCKFLKFKT